MKTLLVALAVALSIPTAALARTPHTATLQPRCDNDLACILAVAHQACKHNHKDQHHCAIWRRHQPQAHIALAGIDGIPGMTALAWCISGAESGHGQNIDNGAGDLGWFQFTYGTYYTALTILGEQHSWDLDPETAPVAQQVAAFNAIWPRVTDTTAGWPHTGAVCIAEGY